MTISKIKVGSTEHDLKAASANKLNANDGSTTQPIYFADGVPKSCTYTLNTSVPSNAKFTDTTYTFAPGDNNGQIKVTPSGGSAQNISVQGLGSAAYTASTAYAASSHTHDDRYYTESEINSKINTLNSAINKKMGDFSIELYNGTGGNPKPVRFASFNYSTCGSEEGIAAKISLVSGHGNGSAYAFLEDAIIRVNFLGQVEVDNFKYYGQSCGAYDGESRQYGDIFWLIDTTNKIVDFYVLMGQYARVQQTPWKRLTYSSKGSVTQYTSCTVYSTGAKNWANNNEIATKGDIPEGQDLSKYAVKATTLSGYGITDAYTKSEVDTKVASAKTYTDGKIDAIVGEGASETLDTIGEISAAITGNQDILATLNNAVGNKANASDLTSHINNKSNPHGVTAEQISALPTTGGSISGNLSVSGKIMQGTTSSDATIANMNRYQSDLYVQGDGSAPNNPRAAGFYLGKSQSDGNRHMDIVSDEDYSYIDFNQASHESDYDARLLVNVNTGDTQWMWGPGMTTPIFNVMGYLRKNGVEVATVNDLGGHTGDKNNPHGVTAAQVGAYTKSEIDTKLAGKSAKTHTHTVSHTPAGGISETSITPAGTVSQPTFTGTAASHNHGFTGTEVTLNTKFTPAGSVSSTFTGTAASHNHGFTGTAVTSGAPSGTATVASSTHTHEYTPAGTVSQPTFTGTAVTSGASSETTSVYSITGVGSTPSLTASVTNRCLTLTFGAGSVPTRSSVTLPSTSHTHSVTAAGTVSRPTFTGTKASTTSISGTTSVAKSDHTHSVTAAGTVGNKSITPAGTISSTFTGTEGKIAINYTPAGTVGDESITPTGTVSQPTFTGTAAKHSHTFTGTAATLTTSGANS